jgi:phosphoglycerate dehydrogenase-like enzyme
MRVLIAEHDHPVYAQLLREAAPDLEVLTSGDSAELARQAADCPVWLGQPDLLATLLRQGHQPQWLQSTWAGITPLLADGLPRHYRLTRAVGIFGQVMAEYVLTYMLGHEREVLARLVSQVERKWDSRHGQSLAGRKVLIVGTGDIGQTVAQFLQPFGVELYGIASSAREQAPFVEVGSLDDCRVWSVKSITWSICCPTHRIPTIFTTPRCSNSSSRPVCSSTSGAVWRWSMRTWWKP